MRRATVLTIGLLVAGGCAIGARNLWEAYAPILPTDSKALVYFRDYLILFPAALCWYVCAVRASRTGHRLELAIARLLRRLDRHSALLVALLASSLCLLCCGISILVFQTRAQIVDEAAYLFQAKLFAAGRLWGTPPDGPAACFSVPYVVLTDQRWFSAFFPGPSVLLMLGVFLGAPFLIGPLLSGLLLALTVWAGTRLFDRPTGLLAGALMLISPFFLFQGASYFGHVITAIFFIIAVIGLLTFDGRLLRQPIVIGICGGMVLLCRPLSAVILGLFALCWWLWQARNQPGAIRLRSILLTCGAASPAALTLLAYDWLLTGDALRTPHQIVLPGEHLGLGWHTVVNTAINMLSLGVDLLGVPLLALLPLLFFIGQREHRWLKPLTVLICGYIFGYGLYPYHGLSYGPRFYYEIAPLLIIVISRGILSTSSVRFEWFRDRVWNIPSGTRIWWLLATVVIAWAGVLPPRFQLFHARGSYLDIRPLIRHLDQASAIIVLIGSKSERLDAYLGGFQLYDVRTGAPPLFARDLPGCAAALTTAYPSLPMVRLNVDARRIENGGR